MSDFETYLAEDARLVILKELAAQPNASLNETILAKVLETFGYNKSREWVRTQMRKLAELGAVSLTEAGTVLIATLKQPGLDHVKRRVFLDGVNQPSLDR